MLAAIMIVTVATFGGLIWWCRSVRRDLLAETQRLRAEAARTERQARWFETIVEHSSRGLILLDAAGRTLTANRQALDLLGAAPDELLNRELWNGRGWIGKITQGLVKNGCLQALAGHPNRLELEPFTVDRPRLELFLSPVPDAAGVPQQILVECRVLRLSELPPITEIRVTEALAILSRLANRVAHDVNNPLAGIRNSFHLLRDAVPDSHPHYQFVDAIDREISRLADFSRRLHESFDVRTAIDSRPTIRAVCAESVMGVRQADPPIPISVDLGPAAYSTVALPGLVLRLLIRNLVQDLVDNTPSEGRVSIGAEVDHETLVLGVAGSGAPGSGNGASGRVRSGIGRELIEPFAAAMGIRIEGGDGDERGPARVRVHLPLSSGTVPIGPSRFDRADRDWTARLPQPQS
jgi:signal transduction histidine kinase